MPLSNVIKRIGSRKKGKKEGKTDNSNKNGRLQMYVNDVEDEEDSRTTERCEKECEAKTSDGQNSGLSQNGELSAVNVSGACVSSEGSVHSEGNVDGDADEGVSRAREIDSHEMAEISLAASQETHSDPRTDDVIAERDQTSDRVIDGEGQVDNERGRKKENLTDRSEGIVDKSNQGETIFNEMQIFSHDGRGERESECISFTDSGDSDGKAGKGKIPQMSCSEEEKPVQNCVSRTENSKSNGKCNKESDDDGNSVTDEESLTKRGESESVISSDTHDLLNTNEVSADGDSGSTLLARINSKKVDDQLKEVISSTLLINKPSEEYVNQDVGNSNCILEEINISHEVLETLRKINGDETKNRVAIDGDDEKSQKGEAEITEKNKRFVVAENRGKSNHYHATDSMLKDVVMTTDVTRREMNPSGVNEEKDVATSASEGQSESIFTREPNCDLQLNPQESTQEKIEIEDSVPDTEDLDTGEMLFRKMDDQASEDRKRNFDFSDHLCSGEKENTAQMKDNSDVSSTGKVVKQKQESSEVRDETKTIVDDMKQTEETKGTEQVNIQHEALFDEVKPGGEKELRGTADLSEDKRKEPEKDFSKNISMEHHATVVSEVRTEPQDLTEQEKQPICQMAERLQPREEEEISCQGTELPDTKKKDSNGSETDPSELTAEKAEAFGKPEASEESIEDSSAENRIQFDASERVSALTEEDSFSAETENSKRMGEEIMEDPRAGWKVGYLHVKLPAGSKSRGTWKVWHRRWVMVHTDEFVNDAKCPFLMISVYASESGTSRKHSALFWRSVSADRAVVHRSKSHTHRYAFSVTDGTKVVVHLAATSETSTQEWMAAMRNLLWPPNPVVQLEKVLHGSEFEISLIDNDFSCHAGLLGMFGYLVVNSRKLILTHPQTGHVIQEWYLNTVDRFQLLPQCREEDAYKVIVMHTGSDSSTGSGQLTFFCADAIAMLQCVATTIHKVLQYRSSEAQTTADKERYQRELAEIAEWLTPDITNQDTPSESSEDYYKVPRRLIRSLLDIPNFLFERPIGADSPEVARPPILSTSTSVSSFSQDSGISLALPDDFLNCSLTSFTIGTAREHSSSESSDGYSPPSSPQPERKEQPVEFH